MLRRVGLDRIIPGACMFAGLAVFLGHFAIALIQLNSTGLVFIAAGLPLASRYLRGSLALGVPVAIALSVGVLRPTLLPDQPL